MPSRLLLASALVSVLLLVALGATAFATGSMLVLAQAADSASDALTGLGLWWALRVSRKPPDDEHPWGHHGAQPIAALVVAMLVGGLALEVLLGSIRTLHAGSSAIPDGLVAGALGLKVLVKIAFVWLASAPELRRRNAAIRAFRVDAISDVAVGSSSLLGVLAASTLQWPALDAWLALLVAAWIGVSGLALARESIGLLMGTAPSPDWCLGLRRELVRRPGVRAVGDLKARSMGDHLDVWVEIHVDPRLTVGEAHDIGEAIELDLREREGIGNAVVHVDAAIEAGEASDRTSTSGGGA